MYEIYDLYTNETLLGGYTTEAAARRAAWIIFRDHMWSVRKTA